MLRNFLRLGIGGALATLLFTGCGDISFVEVTVKTTDPTNQLRTDDLFKVARCEVAVSGADSDIFVLDRCQGLRDSWDLGPFQYGTDASSGSLTFDVKLFGGSSQVLGQGSTMASIKKGGRQQAEVTVTLDAAAFK